MRIVNIDPTAILERVASHLVGAEEWEQLPPMQRHEVRESMLPVVISTINEVAPIFAAGSNTPDAAQHSDVAAMSLEALMTAVSAAREASARANNELTAASMDLLRATQRGAMPQETLRNVPENADTQAPEWPPPLPETPENQEDPPS